MVGHRALTSTHAVSDTGLYCCTGDDNYSYNLITLITHMQIMHVSLVNRTNRLVHAF